MLTITIPSYELFDAKTETFTEIPGKTIQLEHSLVSLSKWEAIYKKSFLKTEMTPKEFVDYIKCMTITKNVPDSVYGGLTKDNLDKVTKYIGDPMTATTFNDRDKKTSRDIITNELIYYWMISLNIPLECEKWHLNRLMTLIHVCSVKQEPAKNIPQKELMKRNASLNAARRAKHRSKG